MDGEPYILRDEPAAPLLGEMAEVGRVFEVDRPATQRWKRHRLAGSPGPPYP